MARYLVRVGLEYCWEFEPGSNETRMRRPNNLPREFGPFFLKQSPNIEFALFDLGWSGSERAVRENPDWDYPVTLFYLETTIELPENTNPKSLADRRIGDLESLFRLFQPGGISLRRINYLAKVEGHNLRESGFLFGPPIRPHPFRLYDLKPYPLDDALLDDFPQFFNHYWQTMESSHPAFLATALTRFGTSYERLSSEDRLVDLVIALEALFGDGDSGSISYKVATRSASWLNPLGKERLKDFRFIKKMYTLRSRVVHGANKATVETEDLGRLEGMVRASLLKALDCLSSQGKVPVGQEIDELIMTGKL